MSDVSWSLSETGALALKAARGAGMSWGLAEEASHAVIWLAHRGAPGIASLCRHLAWYKADHANKSEQCPIAIGAAISDGAIALPCDLGIMREPLLLVPFISASARHNEWTLHIDELTIDISASGFSSDIINTALLIENANCRISPGKLSAKTIAKHKATATTSRIPGTASACIKTFEAFAHHTYAPSTEQSRLAGAGSGLSDND